MLGTFQKTVLHAVDQVASLLSRNETIVDLFDFSWLKLLKLVKTHLDVYHVTQCGNTGRSWSFGQAV